LILTNQSYFLISPLQTYHFMTRLYIFFVFLILSTSVLSQDLAELDRRGGFKDLKLTSDISQYEGLEFKKNIEDETFPGAQLYVNKKDFYTSIGTIKIHKLEVKCYKGKIYDINIIVDKDPNMYKGLEKSFGEPQYSVRAKAYYWSTENIRLLYRSYSKTKLEMGYYSYSMEKLRKKEKKDALENVVDDF